MCLVAEQRGGTKRIMGGTRAKPGQGETLMCRIIWEPRAKPRWVETQTMMIQGREESKSKSKSNVKIRVSSYTCKIQEYLYKDDAKPPNLENIYKTDRTVNKTCKKTKSLKSS